MGGAFPISCALQLWKRDTTKLKTSHIWHKFKCEVVWCAEERGNHKTVAILGVDESNCIFSFKIILSLKQTQHLPFLGK
jgi:hypothetical protein